MPSTVADSVAVRLAEIERKYRAAAPKDRRLSGAILRDDFDFLLATLRREMAKTEALRSSLDRVCKKVEEAHAATRGRRGGPLAPLLEAKRPPV
jgi:hypothetical protein